MPLSLPAIIIADKNNLFPATVFYELLEIQMSSGTIQRIANNNIDVEWASHTWTKFSFQSGDDEDTASGDEHSVVVKVSNVTGAMQGYLEQSTNGLIGDTVIYRYVHPDSTTPAIEEWFEIIDAVADPEWVTFTLGAENWFLNSFPAHVFRRNVCRYRPSMTSVCPYTNNSACDRRFATCIGLGQSSLFGGQPAIPGGGFIIYGFGFIFPVKLYS